MPVVLKLDKQFCASTDPLDSLLQRRHVLTGEFAHYCWEWDGLPVDETCHQTMKDDKGQLHEVGEWPCGCYFTKEDGSVWELTEPLRKLTEKEVEAKWANP